ncbi:MAG TPA: hypothetical protein VNQ81_12425 [Povalibacter sp.]|nr:hypothetical protein [Povalibacter sp.]
MMRILAATAIALFSFDAFADGWSSPFHVEEIYVYGTQDTLLVKTTGTTVYDTANGCAANTWSVDTNNEARRQRIYAGLLAAQKAGHRIQFWWVAGCGVSNSHTTTTMRVLAE